MKSKNFTLALLATVVLLTGCWQKSVYPFYKTKDIFFEAALLGSWREGDKSADETETWTFTKGESDNAYHVLIVGKDSKIDCDGRLFKMGDQKFLDLQTRERGISAIPGHHLFRVRELGKTFKLQMLSPGWFKDRLQLHPNDIPNVLAPDPESPNDPDKGEFILTADTDRLQKYVLEHMNDEKFWEEEGELKKVEAK